jgi:uncharacterized protein (DUF2267 family)
MTDYVMEHAAVGERKAAEALLEQTLAVFAGCLTRSEAQRLADDLPAPVSEWIMRAEHGGDLGLEELYDRVRDRLGVKMGVAIEQAQVAVAAMARELRPDRRQWLGQRMGDRWKPLFEERRRPSSPSTGRVPRVRTEPDEHRTLAEGRAGSSKPLSESAPSRTQPDSVAEDNPYGDRKVSSSHDVHAEPMSSGKPGSKHPLSEEDSGG